MTNQAELEQAKADLHTAGQETLASIETLAKAAKEAFSALFEKAAVATPAPAPVALVTVETAPPVEPVSPAQPSDTPPVA